MEECTFEPFPSKSISTTRSAKKLVLDLSKPIGKLKDRENIDR